MITSFIRFLVIMVLSSFIIFACVPKGPPPPPPPAESLLLGTPFLGDETELREQPPETTRVETGNVSIEGWMSPPEKILRFPVELREAPHLSFRFYCQTTTPVRIGDLIFRVDYVPETYPSETGEIPIEPIMLFETTPVQTPRCFDEWILQDIDLTEHAPGRGELRFILDGPLAGDPGIDFFWGEPLIYHPLEARHKNILLIGVDTLRRDALSVYGASPIVTPNLVTFAEKSTTFTQARAQGPWTLPSFASMITGKLPSKINSMSFTGHLPERPDTIGEILLKNGYAKYTICSNPWLGYAESGFHQGMEEFWFSFDASAGDSVDQAIEFINRTQDQDWFIFLHFMDPHIPYNPRGEYRDLLLDPLIEGPYTENFDEIELWKSGEIVPPPEYIEQVRNLYLGEVAYVDAMLARLYKELEDLELLEETLIVFSADHGEEFFEHGGFDHGHTQFDELVHMPLIVMGEGFPAGSTIDTNVGNTDIMPTILRYIGLDIPVDLFGFPLQDVVAGIVDNSRIIFGEDNTRGTLRKFGVEWPYKCIVDWVTSETVLFNLENDPGEQVDISLANADLTNRLKSEIITNMLPTQSAFYIWITRSQDDVEKIYSGSLTVPDGLDDMKLFGLSDEDTWSLEGNTLTFTIKSASQALGPSKNIAIIPSIGSETLTASVEVNGEFRPDLFYPFGDRTQAESREVTVTLDDYPLGMNLPYSRDVDFEGFYIWGVRGSHQEENRVELGEETKAQLRAIGYTDQ